MGFLLLAVHTIYFFSSALSPHFKRIKRTVFSPGSDDELLLLAADLFAGRRLIGRERAVVNMTGRVDPVGRPNDHRLLNAKRFVCAEDLTGLLKRRPR